MIDKACSRTWRHARTVSPSAALQRDTRKSVHGSVVVNAAHVPVSSTISHPCRRRCHLSFSKTVSAVLLFLKGEVWKNQHTEQYLRSRSLAVSLLTPIPPRQCLLDRSGNVWTINPGKVHHGQPQVNLPGPWAPLELPIHAKVHWMSRHVAEILHLRSVVTTT